MEYSFLSLNSMFYKIEVDLMWRKEKRFTKKGRETDGILFAFLVCSKYCTR